MCRGCELVNPVLPPELTKCSPSSNAHLQRRSSHASLGGKEIPTKKDGVGPFRSKSRFKNKKRNLEKQTHVSWHGKDRTEGSHSFGTSSPREIGGRPVQDVTCTDGRTAGGEAGPTRRRSRQQRRTQPRRPPATKKVNQGELGRNRARSRRRVWGREAR